MIVRLLRKASGDLHFDIVIVFGKLFHSFRVASYAVLEKKTFLVHCSRADRVDKTVLMELLGWNLCQLAIKI